MKKGKDQKPHIGIFGRRNTGKSSFINMLVGQDVAIVADVPGTTTDPVKKSIEIFGIGPAIILDTAGIDDEGSLGQKRVQKSINAIQTVDLAILLFSENRFDDFERDLIKHFNEWDLPFLIIHNKEDLQPLNPEIKERIFKLCHQEPISFSNFNPHNKEQLINAIKEAIPKSVYAKKSLLEHLIKPDDLVLLITPIDNEAPEGRMILPQQMVIRDVLDHHAVCITVQVDQIQSCLQMLNKAPRIAITDSQAFNKVKDLIPEHIPLTSFSVLFAYHKGDFDNYLKGTEQLDHLRDGDRILILESCTHQVNCDDIGRFKLPQWIRAYTGKKLEFDIVSGLSQITKPVESYAMIIQCGGCMVTRKQLLNRLKPGQKAGVPISNYGMTIAHVNGILNRACRPLQMQSHGNR